MKFEQLDSMRLPSQDTQTALGKTGHVVGLYAAMSLLALGLAAAQDRLPWDAWGDPSTNLLLLGPAVGLCIGLAFVVLSRIAVIRFSFVRDLHEEFRQILGLQSSSELFFLAAASSIGEELLFRGALQPWIGLVPQALLFGLLHIGPSRRFLPWTLSAIAMGFVFGWLFAWTGTLAAPIVAHFAINFLNLRFIVKTPVAALVKS